MIIALDYHKTYTTNPVFWLDFVQRAIMAGYTVICATMVNSSAEIDPDLEALVPVVFCAGTPKREACLAAGYNVDIWIDNEPQLI